jgi:hypothetical protein
VDEVVEEAEEDTVVAEADADTRSHPLPNINTVRKI